jgi:hypothetical protein
MKGIFIILAILSFVFIGIVWPIISIYNLVINWEILTRIEIFWSIFWIALRDVVAFAVAFFFLIVAGATNEL